MELSLLSILSSTVGGEVEAVPSRVKGWWLVSGTMQFAHSPHQQESLYSAVKDLIKHSHSHSQRFKQGFWDNAICT